MAVTPQLIKSVNASWQKYRIHLDEEKQKKKDADKNTKKQEVVNELHAIEEKCDTLTNLVEFVRQQVRSSFKES